MPNIVLKNSGFYFRKVLPKDVQQATNRQEVQVALNVRMKAEAHYLASTLHLSALSAISQFRIDSNRDEFSKRIDDAVFELRQARLEVKPLEILSVRTKVSQPQTVNQPTTPTANAEATSLTSPTPQEALPILSEAFKSYGRRKRHADEWTERTLTENTIITGTFIQVCGDRPLNEYKREDFKHFRDTLLQLPPNRTKRKPFKSMSIPEMLDLKLSPDECMSARTVNINTQCIATFFKSAEDEYSVIDGNLAANLALKEKSNSYKPYTTDELKKLFNSDIYQAPSNRHNKTYKFWLPILGLYTGARLNELCQCLVSDVKQSSEGIWYIDINDEEDKRTKNTESIRRTPIHEALIEVGFLDYVSLLRQQGTERLFPDLKKGATGWHGNASKAFNIILKSAGIKEDRTKCFHSFRNNAVDAIALKADMDSMVSQIVGHKQQGMTFGRYFSAYPLEQVKETIDLIEYDIPIEELKGKWRCLVS